MREKIRKKIISRSGGITRAAGILLAAIGVMLMIIFAVPAWNYIVSEFERTGCVQAMKTAKDGLIIEYLGKFENGTADEARQSITEFMPAREQLCPAGGNVYLVRREDGIYETFCGIHDKDTKRRTRLNASFVLLELRGTLERERFFHPEGLDTVPITVNGAELPCVRVSEEEPIRRGTSTTMGYEGVVAFYSAEGDEITYFLYADELHCAVWRSRDGWTGDAYELD